MNMLAGCTGFVGSNICAAGQIDKAYHSSDIMQAYGLKPDLLIYAGLSAEKYLANRDPDQDMLRICQAEQNIKKIEPKKVVLISTIDVWKDPVGVDENSEIKKQTLQPYGKNRLLLEQRVREHYPDALIIRLPGLFGINIKKNFIYDFINLIPPVLTPEKMRELTFLDKEIQNGYTKESNGLYRCKKLSADEKESLRARLKRIGFTALNFTDSRNVYQFYPLERLWDDLQLALKHNIYLLHMATEPVSAGELYAYLTGCSFENEILSVPVRYDFRTIYDGLYGGSNGYLIDKEQVKKQIKLFVRNYEIKQMGEML